MTTKPRLGENIYASDRRPLPIPWKPDVVLLPNNILASATPKESPATVTLSPTKV